MRNKLHIGNLILEVLAEKERSVSWLAKKVSCDSSTLGRILKRNYINTDLLGKIALILEHDFFESYSAHIKERINNAEKE